MLKYLNSSTGRVVRVVLGLCLISWGFLGGGGWIVGMIGFLPLLAGVFNFCFLAPLFGHSFKAAAIVKK